jgi:predicted amidohydrolase YtcJ
MKAISADTVLYNARMHDPDGRLSDATAIAGRDGRIVYLGDDEGAHSLVCEQGLIDMQSALILPGLTDAHLHFADLALGLAQVNGETPDLDGVLARVADKARSLQPGEWILGYGWNHNVWGGRFPGAADLDRVAPGNPVMLQDKSGHAIWVNQAALSLAGITRNTPDPADGKILRGPDGSPSGILLEGACVLVMRIVPKPTVEEIAAAMVEATRIAHRFGLTGVHDMDGPMSFAAQQLLHARGELGLRVVKSIPLGKLDEAIALGIRSGLGDDYLRIGHIKMFADGAMGPRTAWMLEGFEGAPDDKGICVTPPEVIRDAVLRANAAGLACAIHAIGDRANREILDIFAATPANPSLAAPNRIEHAQILHPADMQRFAELGVVASMQPIHATSEIGMTDRHLGKRSAGAYAFKSVLRNKAVVAFGSDCPVETMDPVAGIHAAVTRRQASGEPGPEGWHGDERMTVAEAVHAYTHGAAQAAGWSDRLGSLQVGMLADMTILDRDIYEIESHDICNAKVLGTVVGGRFVWKDAAIG